MSYQPSAAGAETLQTNYQAIVEAILSSAWSPHQAAHIALLLSYCPNRDEDDVFTVLDASLCQAVANVRDPVVRFGGYHAPNFDAWVIAHVGDDEIVAELARFDQRALALLADDATPADHGIRRGIAGLAPYALERWHRGDHDAAAPLLEAIVRRLRATARRDDVGCFWTTGYDEETEALDPKLPSGYQNLGVLHGIPGVLSLLGAIAETGAVTCTDLVEDGVRWMLARFVDDDAHPSRLPDVAGMPQLAARDSTAWCRGDTGALAAMWNGLRRAGLGEAPLMPHIEHALAREHTLSHVADAGICHGAAGMAHLWYRFYLATGRPVFLQASHARLAQAATFHDPALAFGGFGAWTKSAEEERLSWKSTPSLLEGSVGVALAMQASWLGEEPAWDRMLAINLPTVVAP